MMKIITSIIGVLLIFIIIYILSFTTSPKTIENKTGHQSSKPVVLLVVDSLMHEPMQKAIKEGKAPALEFLIKHGRLHKEIVSSYPTMSVTIDSTLLTGTYADQHKVPGLVWFDKAENRLINYGSGKAEIAQLGVKEVLRDGIINLNQKHLSTETSTIYEDLDKFRVRSGSINGLVFRGPQLHTLNVPKIAYPFGWLPKGLEVEGPAILSNGALSYHNPQNKMNINAWQSMGYNNKFTTKELQYLIQNDQLPPFTFAYFPDMDQDVHDNPKDINGITKLDEQIAALLNLYGSWEEAIENATWIVYGDSGQSLIKDDKKDALIDLRTLLRNYQIWQPGNSIKKQDQIVLAVNERMSYVYMLEGMSLSGIVSELSRDGRIGFMAWKDDEFNYVKSPRKDTTLIFKQGGDYLDQYGQSWYLEGDLSILDLSINKQKEIEYENYPDGLARLFGALHSHKGRFIVVDAKPGYEFSAAHTPTHIGGGGHGSLHKIESVTPLIITGTTKSPENERVVDFKNWIISITE